MLYGAGLWYMTKSKFEFGWLSIWHRYVVFLSRSRTYRKILALWTQILDWRKLTWSVLTLSKSYLKQTSQLPLSNEEISPFWFIFPSPGKDIQSPRFWKIFRCSSSKLLVSNILQYSNLALYFETPYSTDFH